MGPLGVGALPIDRALDALGDLLGAAATQRTVAAVDWSLFKPIYEARVRRHLLDEIELPRRAASVPIPQTSALLEELTRAPRRRHDLLVTHLRALIAEVLGFPAGQLPDPRRGFFELGMDSIMAVEVKRRLESGLCRAFPATLAFDYPNVESLVGHLEKELFPSEATSSSTEPPDTPGEGHVDTGPDVSKLDEQELVALLAQELAEMKEATIG